MNEHILEGLNSDQLKAVTDTGGSVLVLAGAGSGKTRVLTSRIAWLLDTGRATDSSIMAVTFTNKAAKEMKARLAKMLDRPIQDIMVGTFHGICNKMLREFGPKIGISVDFHILDETDQKAMCKRILKDKRIDKETLDVKEYLEYINNRKEGKPVAGNSLKEELYEVYERTCKNESAMDFADLMLKCNEAFERNAAGMLDHYRERFRHILVDEFQDTNATQFEWLRHVHASEATMFAVGDDDQSIYSFRGADPKNMERYRNNIAKGGNVIRLEQNYRSTGNILSAANSIIDNNSNRIGKTLRTNSLDGSPITVCEFSRDLDEADFIASTARRMVDEGGNPGDIAVLYRSNFQSGIIEKAMLKYNVPYVIHGGTRFFDRQEVRDAVAYLRLALNGSDDTAFHRIVNNPPRGLGSKTVEPIEEAAKSAGIPIMEAAMMSAKGGNIKIGAFCDIIDEIKYAMEMLPFHGMVEYALNRSGILKLYSGEDDAERLHNLHELVSMAKRFAINEMRPGASTNEALSDFLSTFTLEDEKDNASHGKKAVTLMTVHASKGLEYKRVFITGLEDGQLPHKTSIAEGDHQVEEERRLMYVATTRSREELFMTHSHSRMIYGEQTNMDPSRFLDELPEHVIKKVSFVGMKSGAKHAPQQTTAPKWQKKPFQRRPKM